MPHAFSVKPARDDEEFLLFPESPQKDGAVPAAEAARWLSDSGEGRLAVDVHETDGEIVIKTAIAAVKPEDLEVFVHNDMLTIRGMRHDDEVSGGRALVRECHWGAFSRSIILPTEVDPERIAATLKEGVLTVRMPKTERSRRIAVREL